jgi:hemolysin D
MRNFWRRAADTPRCIGSREASVKHDKTLVAAAAAQRRPSREEMGFLPAALEIMETPPSPIGRIGAWTIVAIFASAIVWASVGTVDIVASATGKVVSTGRSKVVQPLEAGVVRAIHVRDGQRVKAGEDLVELDTSMNEADQAHLRADLITTELDIARLKAALAGGEDPIAEFHPPEAATPDEIALQEHYLADQIAEQRTKIAALDDQERQKVAEGQTIDANIEKLRALIDIAQQTVDIRKALFDKQLTSKLLYLDSYQQLVDSQKELGVQTSRHNETDAAVAAIAHERDEAESEYRRTLFSQLDEAERKADEYSQDLAKAEQRTKYQVLKAPADGVIQQLAVHTVGGVVTPAENLMVVAPEESALEIEALVSNRDAGFVFAGQRAEIKVDAFNFTRYGLLQGKVLSVSQDALVKDRPPEGAAEKTMGAEDASSEPPGQRLVYAARVSLDDPSMNIDGRQVKLSPGMAVTVEIRTGTRRIINYLLSPILKHSHDAFAER